MLELGCGCGIAGIAAAVWGGAATVHLTDNAEVCAPGSNLHRNVAGNGGGTATAATTATVTPAAVMVVRVLDWNDTGRAHPAHPAHPEHPEHPEHSGPGPVPQADLVLGADVLFSWCPDGFPDLLNDEPSLTPALIENNANVAALVARSVNP